MANVLPMVTPEEGRYQSYAMTSSPCLRLITRVKGVASHTSCIEARPLAMLVAISLLS